MLRDGTGNLQCVGPKNEVGESVWEAVRALTHETSVEVTGEVREDARSPGGVELGLTELTVLGLSVDFPITPKEHSTSYLFEHRHLWLRSRRHCHVQPTNWRARNPVKQAAY